VEQARSVPRDELAEALWGAAPPATWDKALTVLVSKLRRLLAAHGSESASALTAAFGCYRLDLPEGSWVDVIAAAHAAPEAEEALAAGDLAKAKAAASVAESLTRSPFLPGEDGAWVEEKRRELAHVRGRALGVLADACLHSGHEAQAVLWAEQAIALEPFRETGYRCLMKAHVATGNRAEALRVYERCRRLLAEELGTYPSPETESVYRGLLEAPPAPAEAASPRAPLRDAAPVAPAERGPGIARARRVASRKRLAAAAVTVATAAALLTGILASKGGDPHPNVAANSIVALDSSGSIVETVRVGARPVAIIPAAGALWVANLDDQSVTRVDVPSHQVVRDVPIGGAPTALAATSNAVWATDNTGHLSEIDPAYNRVTSTRQLVASASYNRATSPLLAAYGSIWIVDPDGHISRVDPDSARQVGSVDVGNDPSAIAAGAGSVWVTNSADGTVTRIDPITLLATTIPVGHGPAAVAVNARGVWIANAGDNALVRVDPATNAVHGMTPVGDGPTAVLAASTGLWVANGRDGTVVRLDPRTGKATKTIHLGGTPDALASAGGRVWVAVASAPPRPAATGGVAHLAVQDDFASLDPALPIPLGVSYATCANLVTYPDKPAPAGSQIVPEIAVAIPTPADGGRTYRFRVSPGFRFSPPSNEAVTASTFKSTIDRVADPRMKSPFANVFSGIVGYPAYVAGTAHELSGVIVRGNTLTIRLARPAGGFLADLAGGAACAVPRDTPVVAGGLNDIPSAGPYYIASYTPRQQLVLMRNPNYHRDRPHHLDQIVFAIGVDSSRAVSEIEAGKADYAVDGPPPDAGPRLETQYGAGSNAAKSGHQQYFISQANGARFLHMNTSRPLFSDVGLRRAVNYAIDRAALAAQGHRFAVTNPFNTGQPTDDYTPPSMAGAVDFHLYPLDGPDIRRAKQIAGRRHATAIMYTPSDQAWLQEAQIIKRNLKPLGIDVEVKAFPFKDFFNRVARRGEPFDLAVSGWAFGSTDPAQVFNIFDGSLIRPTDNANLSYINDLAFNGKLKTAARLSGAERYRAYSQLALELERDLVPVAAFATNVSRDIFSARIGCQIYQPVTGMDLAAFCLRN
jgi:ABC-type transport system substrate-binding protein/DNA-binding SARP family transcriptional activator